MAEIGIIIVSYNSGPEIGPCLDAALASGADVVVVDNASTDNSAAEAARRGARLIANASNRGFAAAVNQGFAALDTPYVLLLNPDAVIQAGLDRLRAACDLPRAAGAGGRLLGADGVPQAGFMVRGLPTPAALILEALLLNRIWPGNSVNRRYRGLNLDLSARGAVEQPAGAFLMIRRAVWLELGGFDEGFYPLWFEDVDFCRRAVDRGYAFYYEPDAVAKHAGAHSIRRLSVENRRVYWYRSLLRYAFRHFSPSAFRAVCLAVLFGCFPRGFAESLSARSLQPLAAYAKVARIASRTLLSGWRDEVVLSGPGSDV
jgi:N-acetylglucosaminyl-diphospho-decaprenol L-rhamnosyltransferase